MIRFVIIALAVLPPAAAVAESPNCCAAAETAACGPARVRFRSESAERQAVAVTRGPGQGAAAAGGRGTGRRSGRRLRAGRSGRPAARRRSDASAQLDR